MNADAVKTWYNATFFKENEPVQATVSLTIQANGATLHIPGINVFPESSIEAIVKAWYAYLLENPIADVPAPAMQATDAAPELTGPQLDLVDFEQVIFRDKRYMVERYSDDSYHIRNLETQTDVNPDSPNGKAIIKRMTAKES